MKMILWLSIAIATGVYICGPIVDPDLWWHITSGRWILAHRELPHVDYWNMYAVGKPWRAYSWSNEIIFAWVDGTFGDHGLITLQLMLSALIALSLFYALGQIARDWFFGGLLGIFATSACFNHFTLRPQSFVWIYFIWLLYLAWRIEQEGLTQRLQACLFGVMVLWANTHITSALGILAVFGWLWRRGSPSISLKAAALCFIGTLVTPYFGGEWRSFFGHSTHPFLYHSIAEFQSATIMHYSTAFLIIAVVCLLTFLHKQPTAIELSKLAVAGLFTLAALAIVKFLPFAVIYLCALIAALWSKEAQQRSALGNLAEGIERLRALFRAIPREGLAFVFICMGIVNVVKVWREPISHEVVPVEAVNFIQSRNLPHPILNDFGTGGYLMYRFSDKSGKLEHLVPIDGRTNIMPEEVWRKFMASFQGKIDWREYLELVKPETILWKTESPLTAILLAGQEWCLVYHSGEEKAGEGIFVKRDYFESRRSELRSEGCEEKGEKA